MKTATMAPILLTLLFMVASTTTTTTTSAGSHLTPPPSSSSSPGGCADSVISFSPCLPYISAPPNDLSDDPSSQCCDIFNGAFASGEAECLCYLVRQSSLLGFPINASKLLSLSDLCSLNNNHTNATLQSICSGSPTLPPLISSTNKPHPGSSEAHPPPPPTTTTPSSPKNASIPVRPPPPTTSKPHRNNGNHFEPAYAIALFSTFIRVGVFR